MEGKKMATKRQKEGCAQRKRYNCGCGYATGSGKQYKEHNEVEHHGVRIENSSHYIYPKNSFYARQFDFEKKKEAGQDWHTKNGKAELKHACGCGLNFDSKDEFIRHSKKVHKGIYVQNSSHQLIPYQYYQLKQNPKWKHDSKEDKNKQDFVAQQNSQEQSAIQEEQSQETDSESQNLSQENNIQTQKEQKTRKSGKKESTQRKRYYCGCGYATDSGKQYKEHNKEEHLGVRIENSSHYIYVQTNLYARKHDFEKKKEAGQDWQTKNGKAELKHACGCGLNFESSREFIKHNKKVHKGIYVQNSSHQIVQNHTYQFKKNLKWKHDFNDDQNKQDSIALQNSQEQQANSEEQSQETDSESQDLSQENNIQTQKEQKTRKSGKKKQAQRKRYYCGCGYATDSGKQYSEHNKVEHHGVRIENSSHYIYAITKVYARQFDFEKKKEAGLHWQSQKRKTCLKHVCGCGLNFDIQSQFISHNKKVHKGIYVQNSSHQVVYIPSYKLQKSTNWKYNPKENNNNEEFFVSQDSQELQVSSEEQDEETLSKTQTPPYENNIQTQKDAKKRLPEAQEFQPKNQNRTKKVEKQQESVFIQTLGHQNFDKNLSDTKETKKEVKNVIKTRRQIQEQLEKSKKEKHSKTISQVPQKQITWKGFRLVPNINYQTYTFFCGKCQQDLKSPEQFVVHCISDCKQAFHTLSSHHIKLSDEKILESIIKREEQVANSRPQAFIINRDYTHKVTSEIVALRQDVFKQSNRSLEYRCGYCDMNIKGSISVYTHLVNHHNEMNSAKSSHLILRFNTAYKTIRHLNYYYWKFDTQDDSGGEYNCPCSLSKKRNKKAFIKHMFEVHMGISPIYYFPEMRP